MKKQVYQKKKTSKVNKSIPIIAGIALISAGLVGTISFASKGFTDWSRFEINKDSGRVILNELKTAVFETKTYTEIDETGNLEYLSEKYDLWAPRGGCTSMAKEVENGDIIVGRNLDLCISNKPAYVVRTNVPGRIETLGLVYNNYNGDDYEVVKNSGVSKDYYKLIPMLQTDVLNKDGFYIEINMRNATYNIEGESVFSCGGTFPGKERVLSFVLPGYLGSRCSTIEEAINLVYELDVYTPTPSQNNPIDWNFAFMMADATGRYGVLEIAKNIDGEQQIIFTEGKGNDAEQSEVPLPGSMHANYYIADEFAELEKMGAGFGRIEHLEEIYSDVTDAQSMFNAMDQVTYFQAYFREDCLYDSKSEFVGYHQPDNYFDELTVWDDDFISDPENEGVINDYIDWCAERIEYYTENGTLKDINVFWQSALTLSVDINTKNIYVRFFEDYNTLIALNFDK